ncbi:MAG: prepilin-type N-terminal cleavage/methylation domain-containing protein [bacterium]
MIGGKNTKCQGFTLLELLIAISLFSIVIVGAIGLFISLIKNQQALLDRAYVLNTLSYTTEYMSKSMRMAQKDDVAGACTGVSRGNFVLIGDTRIKFLNYNNECQEFYLANGVLKVNKKIAGAWVGQDLTPAAINVESLKFILSGQSQDDTLQPKVSFALRARPVTGAAPSFLIQTTISQRMLDIWY